ncbi:uncharacterized protein CLUP02_17315 [Colletotrichum lupini]|uniref:Uncharacterized protein n=1 Tax=Colletotrichum lupini TaxID=145971 RepID=A0A9Q8SEA4_9PEZI|nr:uncharacterized protein CLUP02_17315 [Colletotrichum lupini]UQC75807.1 hypothetical protein CLUP02_17315 [Colletotrichum lupini]
MQSIRLSFVGAGRGGPQHTSAAQARRRAKAGQSVPNFSEQRPSSLCQSGERFTPSMDRHLSFLDRYADPCFMHPPENPPGPTSSLIDPLSVVRSTLVLRWRRPTRAMRFTFASVRQSLVFSNSTNALTLCVYHEFFKCRDSFRTLGPALDLITSHISDDGLRRKWVRIYHDPSNSHNLLTADFALINPLSSRYSKTLHQEITAPDDDCDITKWPSPINITHTT